ncbi:hypothetical protein DYB38_008893 [Aphanomyces astaci]|uniref:Uncharacterized protein n=1 Tax=Aphanomyces astaci TaxID=112090 RepID=A0A397DCC8_APHAT|nr:hypothetical protein DYB38_008893 [Aphanomyces astaci]
MDEMRLTDIGPPCPDAPSFVMAPRVAIDTAVLLVDQLQLLCKTSHQKAPPDKRRQSCVDTQSSSTTMMPLVFHGHLDAASESTLEPLAELTLSQFVDGRKTVTAAAVKGQKMPFASVSLYCADWNQPPPPTTTCDDNVVESDVVVAVAVGDSVPRQDGGSISVVVGEERVDGMMQQQRRSDADGSIEVDTKHVFKVESSTNMNHLPAPPRQRLQKRLPSNDPLSRRNVYRKLVQQVSTVTKTTLNDMLSKPTMHLEQLEIEQKLRDQVGKAMLQDGNPCPWRIQLQQRMEAVLTSLELSAQKKLEIVIKYTSVKHSPHLEAALDLWEKVSSYSDKMHHDYTEVLYDLEQVRLRMYFGGISVPTQSQDRPSMHNIAAGTTIDPVNNHDGSTPPDDGHRGHLVDIVKARGEATLAALKADLRRQHMQDLAAKAQAKLEVEKCSPSLFMCVEEGIK